MIEKVIIYIKDKEFYDDAQLLARSFFAGAAVVDGEKEDKKNINKSLVVLGKKPVHIFQKEHICIINADGFVLSGDERKGTRGEIHDSFKKSLYLALCDATKKSLPWGFLTGVRPAKRAGEIMERFEKEDVTDRDKIVRIFCDRFHVSVDKARLAFEVAENEDKILTASGIKRSADDFLENGFSLYVGIPFCPSTCLYCSFASMDISKCDESFIEAYTDALCYEIEACGVLVKKRYVSGTKQTRSPKSIYIGGGTPTAPEARYLQKIIKCLKGSFDVDTGAEFTVEAGRPDSITPEKLQVLKDEGVNRISVNPQTMNDETLKLIGRKHSASDVEKAFHLVRDYGFDNINMDIILGLPGEGKEHVIHTAERIRSLGPDSLTVHSLAIKRAAGLNIKRDEYGHLQTENTGEIIKVTEDLAKDLGMHPYYMYRQQNMAGNFENVGYARKGKESLYNIVIMEEVQDILAAGAGASSKFHMPGNRYERAINVKSVRDYIERTDEMIERKYSLIG